MRPIVCNTELAFFIPTNKEKMSLCVLQLNYKLERKMKTSYEQIKNARSRYQELFYQQETNLDYFYDQLTERKENILFKNKNNQQVKQNMLVITVLDGNKGFKNETVGLSAEREFYSQEMHFQDFQKRHSKSKSLALQKIEIIKRQSHILSLKKKKNNLFDKQRKILYYSYQGDLKQMKRSFEISQKLDQDDHRITKQKTLDIKPKQKVTQKHDDNTFLTYV
ncbi:unnamed protein product [Paramecium primaurelia]|uniref:Uncharacterized protein n=1 Tax=Paramecium primaurelia TaxID=5886 RepID=A0A8S1QK93_PARPR|nr:unnamed protein product [Paramecium primaurelia]